jgi:hypothetical protein
MENRTEKKYKKQYFYKEAGAVGCACFLWMDDPDRV